MAVFKRVTLDRLSYYLQEVMLENPEVKNYRVLEINTKYFALEFVLTDNTGKIKKLYLPLEERDG